MSKKNIHDVAKHAGVSIKTVSRVINSEPNVRDKTRDVVLKAISELNYRPNASARTLKGRRSYLVGLLYDNPSSSYVSNVQQGVIEQTRARGYDLLIHPCDYQNPELIQQIEALVRHSNADGIILTPPLCDDTKLTGLLDKLSTPYVRISPEQAVNGSSSVHTNDRAAVADLTLYLASLGHRRIAFIIGHPDHKAVGLRYLGYQDGLAASGIKFSKNLVMQGSNSFQSGEECARKLLLGKPRPTAIIASNDDMATGVLRVAHEMQIPIPQQLSVAGFDNVPIASQVWPSLTTVNQPIQKMGDVATDLLISKLHNPKLKNTAVQIDSHLVLRESTGTCAEQAEDS
ncbi:MAG: LacI family DNA-binding transcriptional regulator [Gammaproteobacteria bacterium]|nr:LacI family DNA-binding transcriptional regulator [Gammaproteobacteria bacterium]